MRRALHTQSDNEGASNEVTYILSKRMSRFSHLRKFFNREKS
ncbi:MAG: hypothetical protein ACRCV0_02255 [Brevinema sp.]